MISFFLMLQQSLTTWLHHSIVLAPLLFLLTFILQVRFRPSLSLKKQDMAKSRRNPRGPKLCFGTVTPFFCPSFYSLCTLILSLHSSTLLILLKANIVIIGPVLTSDAKNRTWQKAVATRGDQIVFVGSEEDLERNGLIGEDTKIIRLSGNQIVIPGFQVIVFLKILLLKIWWNTKKKRLIGGIRKSRLSLDFG